MSEFSVSSDIAKEKLQAATKLKQQQEQQVEKQQDLVQKQAASLTTGLQWAAQLATVQPTSQSQKAGTANVTNKSQEPVLVTADVEDIAMLSTSTSLKTESVQAPVQRTINNFLAKTIDMNALMESFKDYYKKSKSHNLLLERFMSHIKFSGVKTLLSVLGVSAEEQMSMQKEVREQTLAEIDARLKEDWAYTKAMLEITG
ncbi:MAG: hypothetical protein NT099_00470 [Candidatus Saganbacteria bacterium]|nr:hypothetical protein [Candidatus Saganbacteria bacterium]